MIFDPNTWVKPGHSEIVDFLETTPSERSKRKAGILIFRTYLSPLEVYTYLKTRFGKPYGPQTFLKRQNTSDNLIHWDYLIKSGKSQIYVQGGTRDVHVTVIGRKMSARDWVNFAQALKKDYQHYRKGMAVVKASLEEWSVVHNRFLSILDVCAGYHALLSDLSTAPDFEPRRKSTKRSMRQAQKRLVAMGERARAAFGACLALDLITPILAESFINLIIFLTQNNDLRENERQYEGYLKQPIDVRLFDLHLKCDHFTSKVNPKSPEFIAFKKMMDRRNDIIHGNFNPIKASVETVYFDGYTPLYKNGADLAVEFMKNTEKTMDISGVISRYHDVHFFFQYLLSLLEISVRGEIEDILDSVTFGFDKKQKKVGIIFASTLASMVLPIKHDDELKVDWSSPPVK